MNPMRVLYETPGLDALADAGPWAAAIVVLGVLAVAMAAACGWRERHAAPAGWPWLLGLRLLAIAAVATVLVGVQRRGLAEREEPSRVVLLQDASASMALPGSESESAPVSRAETVQAAHQVLAEGFAAEHEVRVASFGVTLRDQPADETDVASETRLGTALERLLADYASTPLAAIVLASDGGSNSGPDPLRAAAVAAERGIPIHTLGVGPLREPPNVGLRDLAAPERASVDDRFRVTATVSRSSMATTQRQTVSLVLRRGGPGGDVAYETELIIPAATEGKLAVTSGEVEGAEPGTYELIATLDPSGRDADPKDNRLVVPIELVREPTRVLLAAGGPTRDYRFLRDQLFRDELFTCDVLLQSATGAVTQDADEVLSALPADAEGWNAYDAFMAIDLDWTSVSDAELAALAEWVSGQGGGVVFAAGPVHTPVAVRSGMARELRTLLPVTLRDDPLAFSASIEARRDPQVVRPTPSGEGVDFLSPPSETDWSDFEGFYASLLPADVKPGTTVLARLGDLAEQSPPLVAEQFYGAGRVAYVAVSEVWRLRRVEPAWFQAWQVGLLRRVSQGRIRGAAAEGSLLLDRRRYDLGDSVTLRYVARNPESLGGVASLTARIAQADDGPQEVQLESVEGQPGVYTATQRAGSVGKLNASLVTPRGTRLDADAHVVLPTLEESTTVQNTDLLKQIATLTGGIYLDLGKSGDAARLQSIVESTESTAETTIEIGPPDEYFARRLANLSLAVMAASLLLEWLLRRSWRLA